jgi:fructose-1,6-bisphosphatase/sedoheptulose 1,7-bisphosphatase-like protein
MLFNIYYEKEVIMFRSMVTITLIFMGAALGFPSNAGSQESSEIAVKACCSREMLQNAVDSYVAAQASGDISKMALASNVKYMENMETVAKEKGLWNTALPIAFHRDHHHRR